MKKNAVELTKISQSNIKVISSEDEQKYNNYLEKRLELIDKKSPTNMIRTTVTNGFVLSCATLISYFYNFPNKFLLIILF